MIVYDEPNSRFLKIGPNAVPSGTFPFPTLPSSDAMLGYSPPRATDDSGYVYFDSPIIVTRPAVKLQMRAQVIRFMPGSNSAEAVAQFSDHAEFEHQFRFSASRQTDAWIVDGSGRIGVRAPDGTIWVWPTATMARAKGTA